MLTQMLLQHHGSLYGPASYKARQQGGKYGGTTPSWSSGRRFGTYDFSTNQQRGSMPFASPNGSLEFMNEQNRGPRATKSKIQETENSLGDEKSEKTVPLIDSELYNRHDFVTDYKGAKFFVIKSYTEDHVHRSIKYSVWASTASGNRKLDSAYRAAKEKEEHCPVFLFFSVRPAPLITLLIFLLTEKILYYKETIRLVHMIRCFVVMVFMEF
jgi:YTH domain-containing family protein